MLLLQLLIFDVSVVIPEPGKPFSQYRLKVGILVVHETENSTPNCLFFDRIFMIKSRSGQSLDWSVSMD